MAPAPDVDESASDSSPPSEPPKIQQPGLDDIRQHVFHEPQGQNAWQLKPEIPAGAEIMVSQLDADPLPHNPLGHVWPSKNEYLETQYRLLRREGTEALRYAVNKYTSSVTARDDEDLCIYTKVRVQGYLMTRLGPVCRISFSTDRAQKKILWQQSRRLMPGSVLAISTKRDNFKTICMTATVAQRPFRGGLDQNPPLVDIVWGDINDFVIDPELELVMIEARSGYFEAVRHTLVGLQMAAETDSPLFKYVVGGDKTDGPASFIRENPFFDLTSILSQKRDRKDIEWLRKYDVREPTPDIRGKTSLDETQLLALYRMITKELCIVQGPPGTGKTFTSVEALKIVLANQKKTDPPIIVSAQTNHALDQLLTLCLDAGAQIVRVGSRTESERIAEHTMFNTRQKFAKGGDAGFRAVDANRRKVCNAIMDLSGSVFHDSLLQPADLLAAGVITQEQHDSLSDDTMEQTEIHRPHGPFSLWISGECIETRIIRNKHCDKDLAGDDEEYNRDEYEYEDDFEKVAAVADDEEDKDRLHGTWIPFSYKWTGKEPSHLSSWHRSAAKELNRPDLFTIPPSMRGAVYQLLLERYFEKLKPQFTKLFADYINCCKEGKSNRWLRDVGLVKQLGINIVGCTTTGLTKHRGFLAALGAKTMLIEEAAETRESNITSALYPSLQQLILVGDHQQLTPSCNIKWLGQGPYHLDMSMFERMVVYMGIPFVMLDHQRRMAPEIRAIVNHFYDGLVDHPVARKREPVPGMGDKRTWLFAHNWEDGVDSNHSRFNGEEASMIVNFFVYLINNGIKQSQITVLTFYKAQRRVILRKLKQHPTLPPLTNTEGYQVHTVDSYQGEENDIVLLSLVRSPQVGGHPAVGFLDNKNRVIVAISRARRGFYVFGNINNAAHASPESGEIWMPIMNAFIRQNRYDPRRGLPLQCQRHNKVIWIKNTSGWADNTGGCDLRCNFIRECGHQCTFPCHTMPHDKIRCGQMCGKKLPCGHVCQKWCKDPCNCVCDTFQALKTQTATRKMQDENQLHMDLEELLQVEAAGDPQPKAVLPKPQEMALVPAKQTPIPPLPAVAQPRTILRLGPQQPRNAGRDQQPRNAGRDQQPRNAGRDQQPRNAGRDAGPPQGSLWVQNGTQWVQAPEPIIRPPAPRFGVRGDRVAAVTGPVVRKSRQRAAELGAAHHEYVRQVETNDREMDKARAAALAKTEGQVPVIRDTYRPVALVDGRRVEPSRQTPGLAKETRIIQSGSTRPPALGSREINLAKAPVLISFDDSPKKEPKNTGSPDIAAVIDALTALPSDGSALPKALSTHALRREPSTDQKNERSRSTNSGVLASASNNNPLVEAFFSVATTVDGVDGTAKAGRGQASLDLATLMGPPAGPSATSSVQPPQPTATQRRLDPDMDAWIESLIAGDPGGQANQGQHDGTATRAPAVAGSGHGSKSQADDEDVLIRL